MNGGDGEILEAVRVLQVLAVDDGPWSVEGGDCSCYDGMVFSIVFLEILLYHSWVVSTLCVPGNDSLYMGVNKCERGIVSRRGGCLLFASKGERAFVSCMSDGCFFVADGEYEGRKRISDIVSGFRKSRSSLMKSSTTGLMVVGLRIVCLVT